MRKYLLILLLTGCTPHMLYQPALQGDPTDRYYADVDACKNKQFSENGIDVGQSLAFGGLGLAGGLVYGRPSAYNQIDDCLRAKGYKISAD